MIQNRGCVMFDGAPKDVFAHYKELETIGLAAPQVTYVVHQLREAGLNVSADVTTVEEARDAILEALKQRGADSRRTGGNV